VTDPGSHPRTDEATLELRERGYAVFDAAFSPEEVAFLRAEIARRYDELGRPPTFARPPLEPAPHVEISVVGLVFHRLGAHFPALATRLMKPAIVEAIRGALGADMHLEYTSAVLCNGARPFFPWHAHVGGIDNVAYRKQQIFPTFDHPERLTMLLYLDDLDDETGTLLLHPRRIHDSTRPPHDPRLEHWEGQVELRCAKGTVLLVEQCTWHAARPKRSPGLRIFIACYFTSKAAPKTSWCDDSLRPWAAEDPLLGSVMPTS
jgi:hypothetical protein